MDRRLFYLLVLLACVGFWTGIIGLTFVLVTS